jgi:hypothetical protein
MSDSLLAHLPESWIQDVMRFPFGAPYAYGGKKGPAVMPFSIISGKEDIRGYDCSGYCQHVLRMLGAIGHGVPWMSAAGMADAAREIAYGSQQPGDVAFYGTSSGICHVVMVSSEPYDDGYCDIIGANGGGSNTYADDDGAYVKEQSDYWRSGFSHFATFRDGYGLDMDDWVLSFGLYISALKGYQQTGHFPTSPQGWEMLSDLFNSKVDGNFGYTGSELYDEFLLLNDGMSAWDSVTNWASDLAGAVTDVAASAYDWLSGEEVAVVEEEAEEFVDDIEDDPGVLDYISDTASSAWDWAFGDDDEEVTVEQVAQASA